MHLDWRKLSRVPAGGVVIQVAGDASNNAWLISPVGLYGQQAQSWEMRMPGLPYSQPGALYSHAGLVLLSSLEGGVFRSIDGGATWDACRVEGSGSPIVCFAASPNFAQDATILAGTAGEGVLRSRDGGRSWQSANFGLRDFNLFTLICGPVWERREPVFAGSANGLYYSPNGGRAWKFYGLPGKVVLSLALLHQMQDEPVLFAGTESHGLFRSKDGGRTWEPVDSGGAVSSAINAIGVQADVVLLGTSEQGLVRSADRGRTWKLPEGLPPNILCLSRRGDLLYAGTAGDGLWISQDRGVSWRQDKTLSTRRFHSLGALFTPSRQEQKFFLVLSVEDGLWRAYPDQDFWIQDESWPASRQAFCQSGSANRLVVGAADGVWLSDTIGESWRKTLDASYGVTILASRGGRLWAGNGQGELWLSRDGGEGWQGIEFPASGLSVMGLVEADEGGKPALFVSGYAAASREVQIWRLNEPDWEESGQVWQRCFSERGSPGVLLLAAGGRGSSQILLVNQEACYLRTSGVWKRAPLDHRQLPVNALAWDPGLEVWLLSGGGRLWHLDGDINWVPDNSSAPAQRTITAIQAARTTSGEREIYLLTLDGILYEHK